jgi:16S rRNA (cytosine1402-N4)-methyltransferase
MEWKLPDKEEGGLSKEHIPVLTETLARYISLPRDGAVVDATVGHGGHSLLLGKTLGPEGILIGLDLDENCIKRAHVTLNNLACRVVLLCENFANIADIVQKQEVDKVDFILVDLGFCSAQLANRERGLSFQENMPLDMRFDTRAKTTAADIINSEDEKSLANLIYQYGQERFSRRIARFIVEYRAKQPIKTTAQLATIVCKALNKSPVGRKRRIHPATKTFQALRITVNDELGNLEKLLKAAPDLLKKDGLVAVISFHSLEDKIVKLDFKKNAEAGIYEIITKKPLVPSKREIEWNPRARSAKLRIAKRG